MSRMMPKCPLGKIKRDLLCPDCGWDEVTKRPPPTKILLRYEVIDKDENLQ